MCNKSDKLYKYNTSSEIWHIQIYNSTDASFKILKTIKNIFFFNLILNWNNENILGVTSSNNHQSALPSQEIGFVDLFLFWINLKMSLIDFVLYLYCLAFVRITINQNYIDRVAINECFKPVINLWRLYHFVRSATMTF